MTAHRWIKVLNVGSPVETVANVEVWPVDAPPSPLSPAGGPMSSYYVDGEAADGTILPVGPGFTLCRGAFYSPAGVLVYAPPGADAAEQLADQAANA